MIDNNIFMKNTVGMIKILVRVMVKNNLNAASIPGIGSVKFNQDKKQVVIDFDSLDMSLEDSVKELINYDV